MKEKLLRLIEIARDREATELLPLVDDSPPSEPGQWTAKDQLAHVTAWRLVAVDEIDAVRTGRPPQKVDAEDDVENAKIYRRTHGRPAAAIIDEGSESWDQLAAAIRDCSHKDLLKPRARQPGEPLWQIVPHHTYVHLAGHLVDLHIDRGDVDAAEAAAKWAYEVSGIAEPEDRGRGVAAYNLGCFYARGGRAAKAIPYLKIGFDLRPDLRDWAKKDPDLDPIRSAPEMIKHLG